MKDKTIRMNWQEWKEYCAEHDINPREVLEDYYDLGGGNSLTIECRDDPPEEYEEPAPAKLHNCKCPIIMPAMTDLSREELSNRLHEKIQICCKLYYNTCRGTEEEKRCTQWGNQLRAVIQQQSIVSHNNVKKEDDE